MHQMAVTGVCVRKITLIILRREWFKKIQPNKALLH